MNIDNIKPGDIIKDYKTLCQLLGVKHKGGDSKKSHIKKMRELFSFNIEGRSFTIEEIYSEKHSSLSSGHFSNGIQKIILTKLITGKLSIVTLSMPKLIAWLEIINPAYLLNKHSKNNFIKDNHINKFQIKSFYLDTWASLRANIMYAIDDLDRKNLVKKKNMITICFKGTKKNKLRLVSDGEYEKIKDIENNILLKYQMKNMAVARMNGKSKQIMSEIMDQINAAFVTDNILYYFDTIRIGLNKSMADNKYIFDSMDEIQLDLNRRFIDKFKTHFNSVHEKSTTHLELNQGGINMYDRDYYENVVDGSYVDGIEYLINTLININSP